MNKNILTIAFAATSLLLSSCRQDPAFFSIDVEKISIGPDGGVKTLNVSSTSGWTATTQAPWITISPANGRGSTECSIIIDSTLISQERSAAVQIRNLDDNTYQEFTVSQDGYQFSISLEKDIVEIPEYADYGSRGFDVLVKTNVDFEVVIPEDASWIVSSKDEADLDRGVRPRNVPVHFDWKVNSRPQQNTAEISFRPLEDVALSRNDVLKVVQGAAQKIEAGTPKGDSLALLAINRVMGMWSEWNTAEKMEHWDGVTVWKSGPDKGRVRSARFYLFATKEALPYEVKYLTAAEELFFYSNENSFLLSLSTGDDICELPRLRKLTIGAYGLTELPQNFTKLKNLEYLDLSGNNFQSVPEILTPENFPKMTALIMNANQRHVIGDLSNNVKSDCGGFIDECLPGPDGKREFPRRFLRWKNLDTLRLSVNYFQGEIPDLMDDPEFPKWTAEEVHACDTLPDILIGLPKVLPDTDFFAINLNRFHGTIPDWMLYHPKLDLWFPFLLVFSQDGKDLDGNAAGFTNEPANLNYYYEHYKNKKYNPNRVD